MSNDLYYNGPTQVKYFENGYYYGAIAYHDFLIIGATGEIVQIKEVLKRAADVGITDSDQVIIEFDWIDLNDIILYGKAL